MELTKLNGFIKKYWVDMGWESPSKEWELKLTTLIQDSMILLKDAIDQSKPFFLYLKFRAKGKNF